MEEIHKKYKKNGKKNGNGRNTKKKKFKQAKNKLNQKQ